MAFVALSSHKKGCVSEYKRIKIRPLLIGNNLMLQFEKFTHDNKALHENLTLSNGLELIENLIKSTFYQIHISTSSHDYQIFASKKINDDFSVRAVTSKNQKAPVDLRHDKKKSYILDEEKSYDFLIKLGISKEDGKIIPSRMNKFRQLNRYLEFIRDILPELKKSCNDDLPLRIIDFGCGKAYLTFALYYYLVEIEGLNAEIIGLDLKADVIDKLNRINKDIGFKNLIFQIGDITGYEDFSNNPPRMVVSLHACDIATDASIEKAVKWNSPIILAVPCCQHEVNHIIDPDSMASILKHGLFKERFSALLTDSLRGLALEAMGYSVQMVEFIDMDHTPKNVLIRAIKHKASSDDIKESYYKLKEQFGVGKVYTDKIIE